MLVKKALKAATLCNAASEGDEREMNESRRSLGWIARFIYRGNTEKRANPRNMGQGSRASKGKARRRARDKRERDMELASRRDLAGT